MKAIPTLRHFQYLSALVEQNNFHRAAEACHVTQPALSSGIRELENILGLPVIDRAAPGRKIRLTVFGERVHKEGQATLNKIDHLMQEAAGLQSPFAWPVRMGVIPTIAPYLLPVILSGLQKRQPKLNLSLHEGTTENILEKIRDGSLDMALMAFPYQTDPLETKILYEENFFCAVPKKDNPFEGKKNITLDDLNGQKILLLEDGHCLREHALAACRLQLSEDKQTFRAASLPTLIQMVAQGYGITLLPDMALGNARQIKGLSILPFKKEKPSRQIGLVWRKEAPMAHSLTLVAEAIRQTLKDKHYPVGKTL